MRAKDVTFVVGFLLASVFTNARGQLSSNEESARFSERNLSGPRMGFTYVPDDGKFAQALHVMDVGRLLSQFGWHFEYQVTPSGGGPSFLVEAIPLVGGVESGRFMPSLTVAFGIRLPNGIEFGMGPNVSRLKLVEGDFSTALVMAVGYTFDYGGVGIPINLAYVTSPVGGRIAFVFGYAIQRSSK